MDFDSIGSWFKDKLTAIAWAEKLPETTGSELITVKGIALMSAIQPLVGVVEVYETFVTAYSSSVDETDATPFITASGETVRDGIVAANFLPLGTKIKIPEYFGNKIFVVKDRMARKHDEKVDIWFPSKELAKAFGKRKLQVQVVEEAI
ncbi:MAG: 3D domain-containing protein [Parcubacteria group bacterium]|nr:3D domain-containing protein [Parcubacteria group bacterium]